MKVYRGSTARWVWLPVIDPLGVWSVGAWVDFKSLRSWLRHPILTFGWWRVYRKRVG